MLQIMSKSSVPPFDDSFSDGVRMLYGATERTSSNQRGAFLQFLNDYGTHYVTEMLFGAQVSYTQKYRAHTTQSVGRKTLEECTTK